MQRSSQDGQGAMLGRMLGRVNLEDFVTNCRDAVAGEDAIQTIQALMRDLIAEPGELAAAHPAPTACKAISGQSDEVFEDASLSIMLVHAPPGVQQPPHDHRMSVVIGGYAGVEAHRLFRRTPDAAQPIEPSGESNVGPTDVLTLGARAVHAIDAVGPEWSSAVHVYLGELSAIDRSLFHPETFAEEPLDLVAYDDYCIVDSARSGAG